MAHVGLGADAERHDAAQRGEASEEGHGDWLEVFPVPDVGGLGGGKGGEGQGFVRNLGDSHFPMSIVGTACSGSGHWIGGTRHQSQTTK